MKAWFLLAGLACAASSVACSSKTSGASADAGGDDGGDDAGIPDWCPTSTPGISKGPWSLAVDTTSAKVRWEACHAGTNGDLYFAPESGGAEQKVASTETPITITQTYHAPLNANAAPDWAGVYYTHEASLTGLTPSTCYTYRLGALDASTPKGRFCTMRNVGEPVRFMAIGDTNPTLNDNTAKVLANVLPKKPDFVLHGGDIQYYDSTLETWAAWFPIMQPMLNAGAFFPAIGNHEDEKQSPNEINVYSLRFFGKAGFDGTDTYYRVTSGGVWLFSVDTELPLDPASAQGQWLVQSLDDASKKPGFRFSIVFMHKPFLTCGDTGDAPAAFAYFNPLFVQYKVALVLQAHMHGYERFETPSGVTYVTTGGGGGLIKDPNQNTSRSYCNQRVAAGDYYHAMIFDVATGMLTGSAIDRDGATRDTFAHAVP